MGKKLKSLLSALVLVVLAVVYFFFLGGNDAEDVSSPGIFNRSSRETVSSTEPSSDLMSKVEIPYFYNEGDDLIVEHMGYTLSYNSKYRVPNWVAYELLSSELYSGDKERLDEFTPDPQIKGRQAYDSDYIGSGYDRGHLAPAGDMKWSSQAMKESFYLSNVCPQNHNLNAGAWNDLEKQVRYEAKYYDKVWVVCGPVFDEDNYGYIGENHVKVPDAFFKALLAKDKKGDGYVSIAFLFPNETCVRNLTLYAMTVDELEKELGIDLFYNLEDTVESEAEAEMDPYNDWRIRDEILRY